MRADGAECKRTNVSLSRLPLRPAATWPRRPGQMETLRTSAPPGSTVSAERSARFLGREVPASEADGNACRSLERGRTCGRRLAQGRRVRSLDRLTLVRLVFVANHRERGDGPSALSIDDRRAHLEDARSWCRAGRSVPSCERRVLRARAPRPTLRGGIAHRPAFRRRACRRPRRPSQAGRRSRIHNPSSHLRSSSVFFVPDACARGLAAAPVRIAER